MRHVLLLVCLGLFTSGCAIGNTHRYDLGDASLEVESDKTVAVTAVDVRPYVISGDKTPSFSGLMRGGFGNPFDISTESGRPLADDMTISIVESLKAANVNAVGVNAPPKSDVSVARERLLATEAERYVLLRLDEWKSDSYLNIGLTYNMTLDVLRKDGSVVAAQSLRGEDDLGVMVVPADHRVAVEKAFKGKLEEFFSDPGIMSALQ